MFIRVETSSGVPITRQIADQIRAQCASGAVRPGDRIPSVRELAGKLAVNQNTILKVYERLTSEGLLEMRRGDGTYISDKLPRRTLQRPRKQLQDEVERLVRHATALGIGPEELHTILDAALSAHGVTEEARP